MKLLVWKEIVNRDLQRALKADVNVNFFLKKTGEESEDAKLGATVIQKVGLLTQEETNYFKDRIIKWDEIYLYIMQGHGRRYSQVQTCHLEMVNYLIYCHKVASEPWKKM